MLWVCSHYKYFHSHSAGTDFSRQNLTSTDYKVGSGAVRVKLVMPIYVPSLNKDLLLLLLYYKAIM